MTLRHTPWMPTAVSIALLIAPAASGRVFEEDGDAGGFPGSAMTVVAPGGGSVSKIGGSLGGPLLAGDEIDLVDLYLVDVCDPEAFVASLLEGTADFDTQLWVFKAEVEVTGGTLPEFVADGFLANDNANAKTLLSQITNAATDAGDPWVLEDPGYYFLGISGFDHDPFIVEDDGTLIAIFDQTDSTEISRPDGAGGLISFTDDDAWCSNDGDCGSGDVGTYEIDLEGVCAAWSTPANDLCAGAIQVPEDMTWATNEYATTSGEGDPACGLISRDLWYQFLAPCDGQITIETCPDDVMEMRLAVYDGVCGSLVERASSSGGGTCDVDGGASVTIDVQANEWYIIQAGSGTPDDTGIFHLMIFSDPAPRNDDCANAINVLDSMVPGSTLIPICTNGATTDGPPLPDGVCAPWEVDAQFDTWYTFDAACDGRLTVSTCSSADFDTVLAVYEVAGGDPCTGMALVACNDDHGDCADLTSHLVSPVSEGTTYLIRVGGFNSTGTGWLDVTIDDAMGVEVNCFAPPNDDCTSATDIDLPAVQSAHTAWATSAGPIHGECVPQQAFKDVWYTVTADCTGTLVAVSCAGWGTFTPELFIYGGTCDAPILLSCSTQTDECDGGGATATAKVNEGATYVIRVGGETPVDGGETVFIATCVPTPCTGDLDFDGVVGVLDLLVLLDLWGTGDEAGDINGDGVVGINDLLILIEQWGACE